MLTSSLSARLSLFPLDRDIEPHATGQTSQSSLLRYLCVLYDIASNVIISAHAIGTDQAMSREDTPVIHSREAKTEANTSN